MALIDIGSAAIDRPSTRDIGGLTVIVRDNPANLSGKITQIEIWANTQLSNCEIAIFYIVSGNNYSTRDNQVLTESGQAAGIVTAGSKKTIAVVLDVEAGDYLGIYCTLGTIERTAVGLGYYNKVGDYIPCTNQLFSVSSSHTLSLYGTGATLAGPRTNPSLIAVGQGII